MTARLLRALQVCGRREHLRRTAGIALIVGTALTLINHADVIAGGDATTATWIKVPLNFLVPFVVANLGLLAGRRAERETSS
jgi:hypothetical protein